MISLTFWLSTFISALVAHSGIVPAVDPPRTGIVPAVDPPRTEIVPAVDPPRTGIVPASDPPRTGIVPAVDPPKPGIVPSKPSSDERIVGGFNIDITKVPHQVSLQTTKYQHFCGGSLIHPNFVLTAAHCVVESSGPEDILVYLGSTNRTAGGFYIRAQNIKYHERYSDYPVQNDVALIRLSRPAPLSNKVRLIRLATSDPPAGTSVLATGWGKLNERHPDTSIPTNLQGVFLKTIPLDSCRFAYGEFFVQDTNICAYVDGKDTCQGDSGGPLITNNTLVGVVSWGIGCAQRGNPGVYASVASYRSWIARTISTL